jgi:type IV secretion system protein TrbL
VDSLNALQRILNSIEGSLNSAGPQLTAALSGFMTFFLLLALVALCYGLLWNGRVLHGAFGLLIQLALVSWALTKWPWFLDGLCDLAISIGFLATGDQLTIADFLDPGALIKLGLSSASVLWGAFKAHLGITTPVAAIIFFVAWLGYCAAFAVMAFKVFWWQVELLIAGAAGMCLLPTLIFPRTAFIATGVLSYAANMFARFLLGALLAGVLWKNLDTFGLVPDLARKVSEDAAIQAAFAATGTAWILAACFLGVNKMAGMLTSGIPGMAGGQSLGSLARLVTIGAAAVTTAGAATVAGSLGMAGGARAGVQALAMHGSGLESLKETARATYAGVQAGAHGENLGRLSGALGDPARLTQRAGQLTLQQLMGRSSSQDTSHSGARHH